MLAEQVQLIPTAGPVSNAPEESALSVPIIAFPESYDLSYQWSVGLIVAGMMKRAKYNQYGVPFAQAFIALKERYRQYKYTHRLAGAQAWNAWYNKFQKPALKQLGRPRTGQFA
jgi:hypothetical protein